MHVLEKINHFYLDLSLFYVLDYFLAYFLPEHVAGKYHSVPGL
jgi:hypothetical protein